MILDAQNLFSNEQVVTASAASTDIFDCSAERSLGTGENVFAVVQVDEAMTDSGSDSTVTVTVQSDALSAFGSPATVLTFNVFAALTAIGERRVLRLPPEVLTEGFLRFYYTVANGNLTTGKFSAFFTKDVEVLKYYPSGYAIL